MTAFPFELMIAMMHMIGEGVLPEPNAIKTARSAWTPEARHAPAAAEGALR